MGKSGQSGSAQSESGQSGGARSGSAQSGSVQPGSAQPSIKNLGEACCGCLTCAVVCPRSCIMPQEDGCGFLYPRIDESQCVHCGSCDAACPVLSPRAKRRPLDVMWAKSRDAVLLNASSSGGVFGELAQDVLREGGVVYGAAFAEGCTSVKHKRVSNVDDLPAVQGSKYAQSEVAPEVYRQIREDLAANKKVLFSGTACQVAGVRGFLGSSPCDVSPRGGSLLCVDVICHGAPSPRLWRDYLGHLSHSCGMRVDAGSSTDEAHFAEERRQTCGEEDACGSGSARDGAAAFPAEGRDSAVASVTFRDKTTGWEDYSLCVKAASGTRWTQRASENWYMAAFLKNASIRPSCLHCAFKLTCGSDITLGDFWGAGEAHPEVDRARGVSAVLMNTEAGRSAFERVASRVESGSSTFESVLAGNPSLTGAANPYRDYDAFQNAIAHGASVEDLMTAWPFGVCKVSRLKTLAGRVFWKSRVCPDRLTLPPRYR